MRRTSESGYQEMRPLAGSEHRGFAPRMMANELLKGDVNILHNAKNELDELDRLMHPHAIKDKVLAKSCIDGLTQFAAELRQKSGPTGQELTPILREVIQRMDCYWGLDDKCDSHVDVQEYFDHYMNEADAARRPLTHSLEQEDGAIYGLYRYAMDMISSHGIEAETHINICKTLIQTIASFWKLNDRIPDQMCVNIDTTLEQAGQYQQKLGKLEPKEVNRLHQSNSETSQLPGRKTETSRASQDTQTSSAIVRHPKNK